MRIDIAIPAYNEALAIERAIEETRLALAGVTAHTLSITVVDNASTDETAELARQAGSQVLFVPERGKGAAVRAAARESSADAFAFIDADLSAHPNELIAFITMLETGAADIIIGSRLKEGAQVNRTFLRTLSSRIFNTLRAHLLGISVLDTQCPLKLMNARGSQLLASGREDGWFFDIEFLARAERAGLTIVEIPISWEEFRVPERKSKLNVLRDGVAGIRALLRIRRRMRTKGAYTA